jgi:lantibiotic modifying enzyme
MEAVPHQREVGRAEARRFYWRYGAHLCIAWLLDAVDMHRENFVIHGADPVLIDAEGIMHPFRSGDRRSLSRTGIIPSIDSSFDASGLGETKRQFAFAEAVWTGIGSDDLCQGWEPAVLPAATHLPLIDGVPLSRRDTVKLVTQGFADVARLAKKDKGFIDAWRDEVKQTPRRVLYRPTIVYSELLNAAASPSNLVSRSAWLNCMDMLPRHKFPAEVIHAEREQLERWDIPRFSATSASSGPAPWNAFGNCLLELRVFCRS